MGAVAHPVADLSADERALFDSLITRELDANGGASVIIADQHELDTSLRTRELMDKFAAYFLACAYSESKIEYEPGDEAPKENKSVLPRRERAANYAIAVVRNSARPIPDLLDYFADHFPHMQVKTSLLLNAHEVETVRMSEYREHVRATYLNGTFRYGPLLQTSLVGVRNEEIGDYFPEFLETYLERNFFLGHVMPWGDWSVNEKMSPLNSDDGPIIWARPGEQMIPTSSLKEHSSNHNSSSNYCPSANEKKKK